MVKKIMDMGKRFGYPAPCPSKTNNINSYSKYRYMGNMFNRKKYNFIEMNNGFFIFDAEHPAPIKKYKQPRNSEKE